MNLFIILCFLIIQGVTIRCHHISTGGRTFMLTNNIKKTNLFQEKKLFLNKFSTDPTHYVNIKNPEGDIF